MKIFTIANLSNLGVRVLISVLLAPIYGIQMVWIAEPVGWFVNLVVI